MKHLRRKFNRAQTGLEYLLILTVVGVIVLAALKFMLPQVNNSSEGYFNTVTRVVLGEKPDPIDGHWCPVDCQSDQASGNPVRYRTCECPAPAFGGKYCTETDGGSDYVYCVVQPVSGCIPNGTCSAPVPACGQITFGVNNCQQACTRQGPTCPH